MELEPKLRIKNLDRFKFIDEPYVEVRKLVLEKLRIPIAPFWHQGDLYNDINDIARLIDTPITFYNQNVAKIAEQIQNIINDSDIKFPVNFCTGEVKEPNIRQQRRVLKGSIWFRAVIHVEFSTMFYIDDPYFPNSSKSFNFPTVSLKNLTYLGMVFQTISYLHDLYNPTLVDEWENRLNILHSIVPKWNNPPQTNIPNINYSLFKPSIFGKNMVVVSDRVVISSAGDSIRQNLELLYPNEYITEIPNSGNIPDDIQTKHTLYRVGGRDTIRVFNNSEFELIPTEQIKSEIKIASRIVRARCELIVAGMFILLGNKKAENLAHFLMTKKYSLSTLTLKDIHDSNFNLKNYVGTVFPYDQYLRDKGLETIRKRLKEN